MKKILAAVCASVLALSTMAIAAFAEKAPADGADAAANTESDAANTESDSAPTADKTDKDPVDTGVEGVAAVLGVAALAAGAMVVAKKRK